MDRRLLDIQEAVRKELSSSDHDYDHVLRVYNNCLRLAEGQDVDMEVLEAAALLHDIARVREDNDPSGNTDHAKLGAEMARPLLEQVGYPEGKIKHVQECIASHRFRRSDMAPDTTEAEILFDADKLDCLGAAGIARSFMWAGAHGSKMYKEFDLNEYVDKNLGGSTDGRIRIKSEHSPQIEYDTKIKDIPQRMRTPIGRAIAKERAYFYDQFLKRLEKEVKGEI